MDPNLPLLKVDLDEIFVLGFDGSFGECLINYTGISDDFDICEFENSFLVFQKLEHIVDSGKIDELPTAIVCEYSSLVEEKFLLLHNVRKHPVLKYIPFIAMNRDTRMRQLQSDFMTLYDSNVVQVSGRSAYFNCNYRATVHHAWQQRRAIAM